MSADFHKRAKTKLEATSAGKFFHSNREKLLPSFDIGANTADGAEPEHGNSELSLGVLLGEGAFCQVNEIASIALNRTSTDGVSVDGGYVINFDDEKFVFIPQPEPIPDDHTSPVEDDALEDESGFPVQLFRNETEMREYMSKNYTRKDDDGEHARYALKRVKATNSQKHMEIGLIDTSIEARFLASISHPNIIKMRGIAGEPLTPSFGIVMDRLYMTLEDQMDHWTEEKKNSAQGGFCGCFQSVDAITTSVLLCSAITVACDLSCALRYLHDNNLVYRDIKPENAGFDVRGDIKVRLIQRCDRY
ncbi:hypothetical protein ACHAWF_013356 [Thalassiosira exigua]